MCGIVGAAAHRDVVAILMAGLQELEYRGYDSAGIAVQQAQEQRLERIRRPGNVEKLQAAVGESPIEGSTGIAHTRWATHGVVKESNAHPHMSKDSICLVHNGIIENHEPLKAELTELGYEFESDTDSEAIVHLIHRYFEETGDLRTAVAAARKRLEGAYAIVAVAADSPGEVVAARAGSSMVIGLGFGEHFIASDVEALRPVTDRFVYLQEGDLVSFNADSLQIFDSNDEKVEREQVRITESPDQKDLKNYTHYMEKEIHEQPRTVRATLEGRLAPDRIREEALGQKAHQILDNAKSVTIVGCGTAYYAACVAKYWIEDLAQVPCNVEIASEFRYRNVVVQPNSVFISVSQSGETADTIAALRIAKERNFKHTVTIANAPNSQLVRESEFAIMMNAGLEISVASTKAFVAMLLNFLILALLLGRRNGLTVAREAEIVRELHTLDRAVYLALGLNHQLKELASDFIDKHNSLFLGRGMQFPIACEGALKLKELSYIHAEGFPAGELKHGPLALVDAHTPVVAVAPSDELLEKVQSNLEEVKSRRGKLVVFANADSKFLEGPNQQVINMPTVHPLLAPIVAVIPLQLLAYHVAVLKGTDVDKPRNLAKSVTVE